MSKIHTLCVLRAEWFASDEHFIENDAKSVQVTVWSMGSQMLAREEYTLASPSEYLALSEPILSSPMHWASTQPFRLRVLFGGSGFATCNPKVRPEQRSFPHQHGR